MPTTHAHKCPGCGIGIALQYVACKRCWWRIPGWLQTALRDEREQCRLAGIAHSQKLISLQAEALPHLRKEKAAHG